MNDSWKQYDKITSWFDDNRNKNLMEREYLELALQHILDLGCGTGEPLAKFFIDQDQIRLIDCLKIKYGNVQAPYSHA